METQTQTELRILPTQFEQKGDKFTRVFENEKYYIYRRLHAGMDYYEVFKRKTSVCIDFETKIPTGEYKETYPRDESFGIWAWCCKSYDSAMKHIE